MINDQQLIVKSNRVIEACYALPLNGHRLLALALASVPREADSFPPVTLRVRDIADVIPRLGKTKRVFEIVEEVVDEIMDSTITLRQGEDWVKFQWLTKAAYKNGTVHLQLNDELLPYFTGLLSRFTSYQLRYVIGFRSAYSFRIYDLCKQYLTIGKRDITLQDLRQWLEIPEKQYQQAGHLKSRILNPAIEDINRGSDLEVTLGPDIKEGRRTAGFRFLIQKRPQSDLELENTLPDTIQQLLGHGVALPTAKELIEQHGEAHCRAKLEWVARRHQEGKVKNLGAFTVAAIREDYSTEPQKPSLTNPPATAEQGRAREKERDQRRREQFARSRVEQFFQEQGPTSVDALQRQFLAAEPADSLVRRMHGKFGFNHPAVKSGFRAWILDTQLPEPEEREFVEYCTKSPTGPFGGGQGADEDHETPNL